ncbi:hypothetical protein PS028_24070, partial [Shigella sonnei]|nr:hypothetical protein [Shigella sonnei]
HIFSSSSQQKQTRKKKKKLFGVRTLVTTIKNPDLTCKKKKSSDLTCLNKKGKFIKTGHTMMVKTALPHALPHPDHAISYLTD